jgi:glycine betaine/choline ABC-type transport system substrate-binding protein
MTPAAQYQSRGREPAVVCNDLGSSNLPQAHACGSDRDWLVISALLLSACSSTPVITVSSKNFTESVFLGELIAQQIERTTDYRVERRLNLGGTFLCHQALLSGEIDVYPEYTGTALTAILEEPVQRDAGHVYERVAQAYKQKFNLVWTRPFGFNNTFAVLVRKQDAQGIQTISDLAAVAPNLTIGFNFEFLEREDGWPGLRQTYNLAFKGEPRTLDLNLVYQALEAGQVDVAIGNSTHGLIEKRGLRMLDDDRGYFPPYDAAPVVRQETLDRFPGLREALDALGGQIPQERMQQVNLELDVDLRRVEDVAAELLR